MTKQRTLLLVLGVLAIYFFVFHNLTRFPAPWFDEGSHLHVPKTLVRYGVYADLSSEGFRYYGPTIGVGPTVMLPIAAMFKLFGIGLLQARIVMALYLMAAIYAFYRLVGHLAGIWVAGIAIALAVSSRDVLLLQYGRELLGEVPGMFFIVAALYLWFSKWNEAGWKRLALVGLLFGLAMITKYQYLLFLAPALILSWLLDILYYRTATHRNFLIPGIISAGLFGIWQLLTLRYLGPSTAMQNFALLRASAEDAAFTFNPTQIAANLAELTSQAAFLGALFPALMYGFFVSLPRTRDGQKWGVIFLLVAANLIWYVVASIGWIRYAFLGLALSSIFIARFFNDLIQGIKLEWGKGLFRSLFEIRNASRYAVVLWLLAIIVIPMLKTTLEIARPGPDYAKEMASYLNQNVPQQAVIETWEPEMGFFTDHNYHYPPSSLLAGAIKQVYAHGEPVQAQYSFVQTNRPDYLLVGTFSKWTDLYPVDQLQDVYARVASFGNYDLYQRTAK